jgi:hypothetical protein
MIGGIVLVVELVGALRLLGAAHAANGATALRILISSGLPTS